MLFGIEPFKARPDDECQSEDVQSGNENCEEESKTTEKEEETATIQSFLQLLSSFLDSEVRNYYRICFVFVLKFWQ